VSGHEGGAADLQARLAVPLGSRSVDDATVYPTMRVPDVPGRLLMGVYDSVGEVVPGSLLDRRSGERGAPVGAERFDGASVSVQDEGIYCGVLYNHYGHFLLESIARLWFAGEHPTAPLIWAGASRWPAGTTLKPWQQEMLDILGVTNPRIVATEPTQVGRLYVPDIGYRYDDWFHPQHAAFLAAYEGPPQEESVRVWLSRSRIAKHVRDLNASALERRLEAAGWTVSHPETQSVREQLDTMARAAVVAGEEGSAFHTLMLLTDVRGKAFHIMRRLGPEHRNMHTVGDARDVSQTFHTLHNEIVVKASGRYVTKISASPSEVLDILEVPRAQDGPRSADVGAADVVDRLAGTVGATSYLEVSVTDGSAVPDCTVPRRTAVASTLPFDPRTYETQDCRLFEMPVAQFVACVDDPGRYGLIRVAAPTVSAGLRDLLDTQVVAHRGTVWVVDLPPEVGGADRLLRLWRELTPSFALRTFEHAGEQYAIGWRRATEGADVGPLDLAPSRESPETASTLVAELRVPGLDALVEVLSDEAVGPLAPAAEPAPPTASGASGGPGTPRDRSSPASAGAMSDTQERLRDVARRVRARAARSRASRGGGQG
jgi:hypothetical protein